jgi:hypothetical protein
MSSEFKDLNELGTLWQSQPIQAGQWSRDDIATRVRAKARRNDRAIFWRNVREVAAGALVVGVMAWSSWLAPGWLPKVGGLTGALCVVFVLVRLVRVRRAHPPVRQDLPLVAWLEAESHKVDAEIDLLRSVRSWYLAPLLGGAAVWSGILMATGLASAPIPRARLIAVFAVCSAIMALIFWVVGWAVWKLNQTAVRTHLQPYAEELSALLDEIRPGPEVDTE